MNVSQPIAPFHRDAVSAGAPLSLDELQPPVVQFSINHVGPDTKQTSDATPTETPEAGRANPFKGARISQPIFAWSLCSHFFFIEF
jgi:hypothetical protein